MMHKSLHRLNQGLSQQTRPLLRTITNMPLNERQRDYQQLQPQGVQNLLNDSNLHEVYAKYLCRSTYAATLEPMENAWSLFPEVYMDPAFAKMEREKVFKRCWVAIDHRSQHLAQHGDVLSTTIGDVPILITNHNGELKGFYNVCRHRGSILLKEGMAKIEKRASLQRSVKDFQLLSVDLFCVVLLGNTLGMLSFRSLRQIYKMYGDTVSLSFVGIFV